MDEIPIEGADRIPETGDASIHFQNLNIHLGVYGKVILQSMNQCATIQNTKQCHDFVEDIYSAIKRKSKQTIVSKTWNKAHLLPSLTGIQFRNRSTGDLVHTAFGCKAST